MWCRQQAASTLTTCPEFDIVWRSQAVNAMFIAAPVAFAQMGMQTVFYDR
jgi:hypothetical protein